MSLKRHALSKAFPSMDTEEQAALTLDIERHGQRERITIYQDEILDGWHRYQACLTLGIEPLTMELDDDVDAVAYVISHNMHRRHLTAIQRAAAVVACHDWAQVGKPKANGETVSPLATVPEMAKAAGVSDRTIQQAKKAEEAGLGDKLRDGELSARKAAEMTRTPKPIVTPTPEPENAPQEESDPLPVVNEEDDELQTLRDLVEEYQADAEALQNILDADDQLSESVAEIRKLHAQISVLKSQNNGLNNKVNELVRVIKSLRKTNEKLEKDLLQYQIAELPI